MVSETWTSLKKVFGALDGGEGEWGQPDLLRRVVEGILELRRHGERGLDVLPEQIEVRIGAIEGSRQVLERFVSDPAFDREVDAQLRNRLLRGEDEELPLRRYEVVPAEKLSVDVSEGRPLTVGFKVEGGDRDGADIPLVRAKREWLLGRGPWHGDDSQLANDVVVCESERRVSRRAARLHRTGASFELQSLDQGDALVVRHPDGQSVRPALSATGRVAVRPGDRIEFTDGSATVVALRLEES